MQTGFDFGRSDLDRWRGLMQPLVDQMDSLPRRKPVGQLVKSLISGRTRDAVSLGAYRRLGARYRSAAELADAEPATVETIIADVTFAGAKAEWLVSALCEIRRTHSDFDLDFLREPPLATALGWLERLPGVGRKVAASTLNASLLARPVLIVDTHVLRVLRRLRFVDARAEARDASEAVTAAMPGWDADDFLRFHVMTKRLGQIICHEIEPDCAHCPLSGECPSAGNIQGQDRSRF